MMYFLLFLFQSRCVTCLFHRVLFYVLPLGVAYLALGFGHYGRGSVATARRRHLDLGKGHVFAHVAGYFLTPPPGLARLGSSRTRGPESKFKNFDISDNFCRYVIIVSALVFVILYGLAGLAITNTRAETIIT